MKHGAHGDRTPAAQPRLTAHAGSTAEVRVLLALPLVAARTGTPGAEAAARGQRSPTPHTFTRSSARSLHELLLFGNYLPGTRGPCEF